ncbi:type II toxin-antitoxin system HicB family antitoxin [Microvirga sp. BT688]|uniref:type II toxin-antitoxin system HicB family antitoxin n=1 Tax=Microvirga sp. TaxID=1873136 RepID=UPI0016825AA8|nr:type II toxin-antitoxin system HicB family antitoxin [Microvirga sp.]MBD2747778.1 type II toxin-antitoxin system HicB family antitoxin [Microvirga sp.]
MRNQYVALIRADENSHYGVSFPDLPGCVTAGTTLEEARAMAEEALALHLEGLVEDEEPVPEPSSLEAVMADPDNRDGVAILVVAPQHSSKAVRVNITLPNDVLDQIDRYAESHGYSRSGFLAHAAKRFMEKEMA